MTDLSPALLRFGDVSVRLSVELGRTNMPLRDVLSLGQGSVVALNRLTDELLDITANGKVVAQGEVIAQDGKFAFRIVNLVGDDPSAASAAPPMPAATGMGAPIDPVGSGFPEPSPAAAASTPPADAPKAEPAPPPPPSAPTEPEVEAAKDAPAGDADDIDDLLDSTLDELTGALDEIAPDGGVD